MNQTDPLAQLRDIHLPDAIGLWPLAPGWWLAIIITLICIALLWRFFIQKKSARAYRVTAQALLLHAWYNYEKDKTAHSKNTYLLEMLELLRRCARTINLPSENLSIRQPVARLNGEDWLAFLDSGLVPNNSTNNSAKNKKSEQLFQSTLGQLLITEPYRAEPNISAEQLEQLHNLALHWIRSHNYHKKPQSLIQKKQNKELHNA